MSYHPLGLRLRRMLGFMDVLVCFAISGSTTWIRPIDLISEGSDGATLLLRLLLKTSRQFWIILSLFTVAITEPSSLRLFIVWRFEPSDSAQFNSLFSAKFWLRIQTNDEISIRLYCHSLGSRLRLLLRLVKVLPGSGFHRHAVRDKRLGWFKYGSDGAILLSP